MAGQGLEHDPLIDEAQVAGGNLAKSLRPRQRLGPVVVDGRLFLRGERGDDRELVRTIAVGEQPRAAIAGCDAALLRMPGGEVLGELRSRSWCGP